MGLIFQGEQGTPSPLGISEKGEQLNFAFVAERPDVSAIVIFPVGEKKPIGEIPLNPKLHQTGTIWHVLANGLPASFDYGIRIGGSICSDPYARRVSSKATWGASGYAPPPLLGRYHAPVPCDWGGDTSPNIPLHELIVYEMHIRGFTESPTSQLSSKGTFLAMIEKIPHLKELGVNCVELLPIFEFNEQGATVKNPKTGKKLCDFWGYSTVNFFAPTERYGLRDALFEFKQLVRELHHHGIEVILDVVYNHTAEGDPRGPTYSFRALAPHIYYLINQDGDYLNFSGCGNTVRANHPVTAQLILDSLRYWVVETHVDGFRFDLASILTRDPEGHPMSRPPLIEAISHDPILKNTKLIAEAWDAAGLYQVGSFPFYGRWAEWNGRYRDTVRRFIKGTDGEAGAFAGALTGSESIYSSRGSPAFGVNFTTAHDGFTLHDLVSYNHKHNEENGEHNRDGTDDNASWNCGAEGPTDNPKILRLRQRQMRNFHLALMVSLGTPMLLMGDEYGHTKIGNNNTWCHDSSLNWFDWDALERDPNFFRFYKKVIELRKNEPLLKRSAFLKPDEVDWHGIHPFTPDWSPESRFVACTLKDASLHRPLYIAFNASAHRLSLELPPPPPHRKWFLLVDTALSPPHDIFDEPQKHPPIKSPHKMESYSALILQAH